MKSLRSGAAIAGKEHKKYEFGNKVALAHTITGDIIVGAKDALNEYDGNCRVPLLDQVEAITGRRPERAFCNRGFRCRNKIGGTEIVIPDIPRKNTTIHYKRKAQANSDAEALLKQ